MCLREITALLLPPGLAVVLNGPINHVGRPAEGVLLTAIVLFFL